MSQQTRDAWTQAVKRKCPFGYDDHQVTWRCYALFGLDWLGGKWPESWPYWTYRPLVRMIGWLDAEKDDQT